MGLRRRSGPTDAAPDADRAGAPARTVKWSKAERKALERAARERGAAGRTTTPLTAARAKRLIGVGTAVAPLLAPYALAAAGVLRGRWDFYRASRLGVAPDQLGAFSGPGGALHARLSHLAAALDRLESDAEAHATTAAAAFAAQTRPRLADLSVGVRAAEQMPASRRRTAFRSIGRELDTVEYQLLTHLGISTAAPGT